MSDVHLKRIFVYGTLRTDIGHGDRYHPDDVTPAKIPGKMLHLGHFPGVVPVDADKEASVRGQILHFESLSDEEWMKLVGRMDAYEGTPHLFRRDKVWAEAEDGDSIQAQVYYYNNNRDRKRTVDSGDWSEVAG